MGESKGGSVHIDLFVNETDTATHSCNSASAGAGVLDASLVCLMNRQGSIASGGVDRKCERNLLNKQAVHCVCMCVNE